MSKGKKFERNNKKEKRGGEDFKLKKKPLTCYEIIWKLRLKLRFT